VYRHGRFYCGSAEVSTSAAGRSNLPMRDICDPILFGMTFPASSQAGSVLEFHRRRRDDILIWIIFSTFAPDYPSVVRTKTSCNSMRHIEGAHLLTHTERNLQWPDFLAGAHIGEFERAVFAPHSRSKTVILKCDRSIWSSNWAILQRRDLVGRTVSVLTFDFEAVACGVSNLFESLVFVLSPSASIFTSD